jgi:FG-GAP repeat protein
MIQRRSFDTLTSRVCWCALALAASGCGVDLSLGELEPAPSPPLVEGSPSAAAPVYDDGIAPARIAVPEVTMRRDSGGVSLTHNVSVGDMDGDGFDDLAMLVRDDISGTEYIHLRYGSSARPSDGVEVLAFSESGARLVVRRDYDFPGVAVNGVHPVGDFDADGYADVFVQIATGVPTEPNGGYLLYGGPERWAGIHELRAIASHLDPGARAPGKSGYTTYSFAAPGDIDGDGFADLAMTNPEDIVLEPGVYVFYGRAERLAAETSWSETGLRLAFPSLLPRTIETGRDEDGDGVLDYSSQKQTQPELSASGDIDGDGLPELLVAYTDLNGNGGAGDRRVIVIRGAAARSTGTLNLLELQPQMTDRETALDTDQPLMTPQAIGDLDGDGRDDFVLWAGWGRTNYLFYGSPELLSGSIDVSQAAAILPGVGLVPVGDRDGDGDDDLMVARSYDEQIWPDFWGTWALATLSGTRTRLSGNVEMLPEPTWEDGEIYIDEERRPVDVMSAGDLDNDGAAEVITLSILRSPARGVPNGDPQIHIHYGVHVPPAAPDGPH